MDYKKKMFNEIHEKLPNAKLVVMSGLLVGISIGNLLAGIYIVGKINT